MKTFLIILLVSLSCMAASQKYIYKDSKLTDEFGNIYKYLDQPSRFVDVYPFPKSTILGTTPKRAGRLYYCSDCTVTPVCVSTGTGIGAFSSMADRTVACN